MTNSKFISKVSSKVLRELRPSNIAAIAIIGGTFGALKLAGGYIVNKTITPKIRVYDMRGWLQKVESWDSIEALAMASGWAPTENGVGYAICQTLLRMEYDDIPERYDKYRAEDAPAEEAEAEGARA